MTIGLFYGSDTGITGGIAVEIKRALEPNFTIEEYDVQKFNEEDFAEYDKMIIGLSTWYDGQLQSDWDTYVERFANIDFTGKIVAMYGLGDQDSYGEWYCDGMGIIGQLVKDNGGTLIGKWPTEGYDFIESKAQHENGYFCGLALDEDVQPEMTEGRLDNWCSIISKGFKAYQVVTA
jgi:flavodoxin I